MRILILIGFVVVGFISCNNAEKEARKKELLAQEQRIVDSLETKQFQDSLIVQSLNKFYKFLDEPNFALQEKKVKHYSRDFNEQYRLIWSGGYSPIAKLIRIKKEDGLYTLVYKEFEVVNPMTGEGQNVLHNTKTFSVSKEQWQHFRALLRGAYYWTMAEYEEDDGKVDIDGSYWSLGGYTDVFTPNMKHSRSVSRSSPHEGSFKQACVYLAELANQNIDY